MGRRHAEQRRARGAWSCEIATGGTLSELGGEEVSDRLECVTRSIIAQTCAVNKALDEREEGEAGKRAVFDEEGIGGKIWATDDGGMFMVKMWVNRKACFQRQENELKIEVQVKKVSKQDEKTKVKKAGERS